MQLKHSMKIAVIAPSCTLRPEAAEAVNTYPVGIPVDAAHKDLARQFRDLLLSDEGRRLLKEAGFGASS